jgi:fructokinase
MRPVIFGEVLFDQFPDGTSVLGGAPFNVAWHLRGFGLDPLMISRVGDDALGHEILKAMEQWGMGTEGIQLDKDHSTGVVEINLDAGQHAFRILPDQAYDFVDAQEARDAFVGSDAGLVYHGTLALRNPVSRAALEALLDFDSVPVFHDVNLRDPWWHAEDMPGFLARCRWLKLNENELDRICHSLEIRADSLDALAAALGQHFGLELVLVTRGERGAVAWVPGGVVHTVRPEASIEVVDTVGAGDAFTSVVIYGLVSGWPMPATLERALSFANAICGIRGATVRDTRFYRAQSRLWGTG